MSSNLVDKDTGELITLSSGVRMWIGTRTAHDLAVQQGTIGNNILVCITDDAPGEEAWQYSTEETRTGKTWIDGKPIYRKVIDFGALPNATTKVVAHGIADVDTWVQQIAIANTATKSGIRLPFADTTLATQSISAYATATSVGVNTGNVNRSDYTKCYFILEYTKSTD